jgi:hypothetical protein
MINSNDLEDRLNVKNFIDQLEEKFDTSDYYIEPGRSLDQLRRMKLFLYRRWDEWKPLSNETMLDSTDCLTLVTVVHLLAKRKGVHTTIVRPKNISRYFHAMLSYESINEQKIFKVSGRYRKYDCLPMDLNQIDRRIKYIRPLINLVNSFRFNKSCKCFSNKK